MLEESPNYQRLRLVGVGDQREQALLLFSEVAHRLLGEEAQEGVRFDEDIGVRSATESPRGRQSMMMLMRERDQGGVALHTSTLATFGAMTVAPRPTLPRQLGSSSPQVRSGGRCRGLRFEATGIVRDGLDAPTDRLVTRAGSVRRSPVTGRGPAPNHG